MYQSNLNLIILISITPANLLIKRCKKNPVISNLYARILCVSLIFHLHAYLLLLAVNNKLRNKMGSNEMFIMISEEKLQCKIKEFIKLRNKL